MYDYRDDTTICLTCGHDRSRHGADGARCVGARGHVCPCRNFRVLGPEPLSPEEAGTRDWDA